MNETKDATGADGGGMIEMSHVGKWYGEFQVLSNCTTSVDKGEVVVICGPSGSGKSTLIKVINGLEPFQEGTITFNGTSVGDRTTNLPDVRATGQGANRQGYVGHARPHERHDGTKNRPPPSGSQHLLGALANRRHTTCNALP